MSDKHSQFVPLASLPVLAPINRGIHLFICTSSPCWGRCRGLGCSQQIKKKYTPTQLFFLVLNNEPFLCQIVLQQSHQPCSTLDETTDSHGCSSFPLSLCCKWRVPSLLPPRGWAVLWCTKPHRVVVVSINRENQDGLLSTALGNKLTLGNKPGCENEVQR